MGGKKVTDIIDDPEHVQILMMERNEYDAFIEDPTRFISEVLLPRKYPRLYENRAYAKEVLKTVAEDKFYSLGLLLRRI